MGEEIEVRLRSNRRSVAANVCGRPAGTVEADTSARRAGFADEPPEPYDGDTGPQLPQRRHHKYAIGIGRHDRDIVRPADRGAGVRERFEPGIVAGETKRAARRDDGLRHLYDTHRVGKRQEPVRRQVVAIEADSRTCGNQCTEEVLERESPAGFEMVPHAAVLPPLSGVRRWSIWGSPAEGCINFQLRRAEFQRKVEIFDGPARALYCIEVRTICASAVNSVFWELVMSVPTIEYRGFELRACSPASLFVLLGPVGRRIEVLLLACAQ